MLPRTHSRGQGDRTLYGQKLEQWYSSHKYNYNDVQKLGESETYRFANRPMQKLASAAIAAVAVTTSRLMAWAHIRYSSLDLHRGSSAGPLQTHVPPVSATIEALTAMMYAMAKKVARPARTSVKKSEPFRCLRYKGESAN